MGGQGSGRYDHERSWRKTCNGDTTCRADDNNATRRKTENTGTCSIVTDERVEVYCEKMFGR